MPWFVCPTSCSNEDYNGNADHEVRTDAGTLHVTSDRVFWTTNVKHTNLIVSTTKFTKKFLMGLETRKS